MAQVTTSITSNNLFLLNAKNWTVLLHKHIEQLLELR